MLRKLSIMMWSRDFYYIDPTYNLHAILEVINLAYRIYATIFKNLA